jgi:hypothetical protein
MIIVAIRRRSLRHATTLNTTTTISVVTDATADSKLSHNRRTPDPGARPYSGITRNAAVTKLPINAATSDAVVQRGNDGGALIPPNAKADPQPGQRDQETKGTS